MKVKTCFSSGLDRPLLNEDRQECLSYMFLAVECKTKLLVSAFALQLESNCG